MGGGEGWGVGGHGREGAPRDARPRHDDETLQTTLAASALPPMPASVLLSADALPVVERSYYEIIAEHARGGLGRILRARDRRTGRMVALKEVIGSDAVAEARFAREARLTATLQHPAIVPVYEVGCWPTGRPFYAMKLVEGRSLDKIVAGAADVDDRLRLVPHVLAVAEALAYAHSQGVIHRDLKPENVLVGPFGETVVIDWGLAKQRGAGDIDAVREPGPPRQGFATVAGAAMGTPAYMAPEQARGEPADERTDVYGIGAVLYHVLSGRPAYEGATPADVIAGVLAAPPPPLESRAPGLPPDLTAIARKAMMPDPALRYPTARELAEDLRRFTTGQLVSAHVYSIGALVARWLGRHRTTVAVAAVLLLVLAATGTMSVARIVRERDRAARLQGVATNQQQAAETLVDYLLDEFLARVEKVDRLDLIVGVGDQVARYYRKVDTSGGADDPDALGRRAKVLQTLGVVEGDQQNNDKAIALYKDSLALRERAAAARPPSAGELVQKSITWHNLGMIELSRGNDQDGLRGLDESLRAARLAVARDPADLDAHLRVARSNQRIAEYHLYRKRDAARALELSRSARDQLAPLLAAHPGDGKLMTRLASFDRRIVTMERLLGRVDDAFATARRGMDLYARALALEPKNAVWAREYTGMFSALATVELDRGRLAEALAAVATEVERYQEIARADPANRATQRDLGWAHADACEIQLAARHLAEAAAACQRSTATFDEHVRHDPTGVDGQDALARTLEITARVQSAQGQREAARATLERALSIAEKLAAGDPKNDAWPETIVQIATQLAGAELELGRVDDGARHARSGLDIATRMATLKPADASTRSRLARARSVAARAELAGGHREAALPLHEAAVSELNELARAAPQMVSVQVQLAEASDELAAALDGEGPRARELRGAAAAIYARLRAAGTLLPADDPARSRRDRPRP